MFAFGGPSCTALGGPGPSVTRNELSTFLPVWISLFLGSEPFPIPSTEIPGVVSRSNNNNCQPGPNGPGQSL